jgi:hypothetical protein
VLAATSDSLPFSRMPSKLRVIRYGIAIPFSRRAQRLVTPTQQLTISSA